MPSAHFSQLRRARRAVRAIGVSQQPLLLFLRVFSADLPLSSSRLFSAQTYLKAVQGWLWVSALGPWACWMKLLGFKLRCWVCWVLQCRFSLRVEKDFMACDDEFFSHRKWNFDGFRENLLQRDLVTDQSCTAPVHPSFRLILRAFLGLWIQIRHRIKSACRKSILCTAADLNRRPLSELRTSAQIPIVLEQLRWRRTKAWKWSLAAESGVWHDSESIANKVCSYWLQMNCEVWKACIDWTSFDFQFKDFLSNLPLKIIILDPSTVLLSNHP